MGDERALEQNRSLAREAYLSDLIDLDELERALDHINADGGWCAEFPYLSTGRRQRRRPDADVIVC